MSFTPQGIISSARFIINDFGGPDVVRDSDEQLLAYVNEGLKEMAVLMPQMFSTIGDMTCEEGKAIQSITFDDAIGLLDVISIHDGPAITPMDRRVFDLFMPAWRQATQGQAKHWAKIDDDPLSFVIYPPAPAAQVIDVRYTRNPLTYALADTIGDVPSSMEPALVDYVVYRSQSKDDEHVLAARAASFYRSFKLKIGVIENAPPA